MRRLFLFFINVVAASLCAQPIRLSPNGMTAVTLTPQSRIIVTDVKSGRLLYPERRVENLEVQSVTSLAVSDLGDWVAIAAGGMLPKLIRMTSGNESSLAIPRSHAAVVFVNLSEKADFLVGKTETGGLVSWETANGRVENILSGAEQKMESPGPFVILPGNFKYVVDAPQNRRSFEFPQLVTVTGQPGLVRTQTMSEFTTPLKHVRDLATSFDGKSFVVAESGAVTLIRTAEDGKPETIRIENSKESTAEVLAVALSYFGERLAVLLRHKLLVYELSKEGNYSYEVALPSKAQNASVRFHSNDTVAFVAEGMNEPRVIKVGTCSAEIVE